MPFDPPATWKSNRCTTNRNQRNQTRLAHLGAKVTKQVCCRNTQIHTKNKHVPLPVLLQCTLLGLQSIGENKNRAVFRHPQQPRFGAFPLPTSSPLYLQAARLSCCKKVVQVYISLTTHASPRTLTGSPGRNIVNLRKRDPTPDPKREPQGNPDL